MMQIMSSDQADKKSLIPDAFSFFSTGFIFVCMAVNLILLIYFYVRRQKQRRQTEKPWIYVDADEKLEEWAQTLPTKFSNVFMCSSTLPSSYAPFDTTSPVKDQGACGLCGMFAIIGLLADQLSRQSNKSISLSEMYLARCIQSCNARDVDVCKGTALATIAEFLTSSRPSPSCVIPRGVPEESCIPTVYFHSSLSKQRESIEEINFGFSFMPNMSLVMLLLLNLFSSPATYLPIHRRQSSLHEDEIRTIGAVVLVFIFAIVYLGIVLSYDPAIRRLYTTQIILIHVLYAIVLIDGMIFIKWKHLSFKQKLMLSLLSVIIYMIIIICIYNEVPEPLNDLNQKQISEIYTGCPNQCKDGSNLALYTASEYYRFERTPTQTDAEWTMSIKCHLVSHGSLLCDVRTPTDHYDQQTMMSAKPFDPTTIPSNHFPNNNHSMVVIGWDDDMGAWIVRNSWSTHNPNKGYIYWKYGTGIERNTLIGCTI